MTKKKDDDPVSVPIVWPETTGGVVGPWSPQPAVVMYGAGVSAAGPQPGTEGWEEHLRRMLEGVDRAGIMRRGGFLRPQPGPTFIAGLDHCALCGKAHNSESGLRLGLYGTPGPDTMPQPVAEWCVACSKMVLDALMQGGTLSKAAARVGVLLDMVAHPFCSQHGDPRPCMQCREHKL